MNVTRSKAAVRSRLVSTQVIGADCATDPQRVGIATGRFNDGIVIVEEIALCSTDRSAADHVISHIAGPTLVALDAPLGWPVALGDELANHAAGQPLRATANNLFRRRTDIFIRSLTGKQSLDVGADRIARTAYMALQLLDELRARTSRAIPLAWKVTDAVDIAAIEVYPAATLKQLRVNARDYKKAPQSARFKSTYVSTIIIGGCANDRRMRSMRSFAFSLARISSRDDARHRRMSRRRNGRVGFGCAGRLTCSTADQRRMEDTCEQRLDGAIFGRGTY